MSQWLPVLLVSLLTLVVPAAILAGRLMRNGAMALTGAGALLVLLTLWLEGVTGFPFADVSLISGYLNSFLFFAGMLLLVGGWAIALASAVSERRWAWVALLTLAVYLSFVALLFILTSSYAACLVAPQQVYCETSNRGGQALILAASFIGPAAILAYAALVRPPRRARELPGVDSEPR